MSHLINAAKRLIADADDDVPWGDGVMTVTVSAANIERLRDAVLLAETFERLGKRSGANGPEVWHE